jgi:hypothetical protein
MAGHLYWQSANFTITAFLDDCPRRVRVIAAGDFSGSGSAVLRGALVRLTSVLAPIHLDASGVTVLPRDGATALAEFAGGQVGRLTVDAVSEAVAPSLDPVLLHPAVRWLGPGHTSTLGRTA